MRSPKAILAAKAASRSNGALGRGPVTKGEKRRSSQNAIRHALLSKSVVPGNESDETFAKLLAQRHAKLRPAGRCRAGRNRENGRLLLASSPVLDHRDHLFDNSIEKRTETKERDRLAGVSRRASRTSRGIKDLGNNARLLRAAKSRAVSGEISPPSTDLNLLNRYENKLPRMYQRSPHNFLASPNSAQTKITKRTWIPISHAES